MKSDQELYELIKERAIETLRYLGRPCFDPDNAITPEQAGLIIGKDQPWDPREELDG